MSEEEIPEYQKSYNRFQNRSKRIKLVNAWGDSEGSEWGEIISALGCAAERMNGMCAEEDIEAVIQIAERDIEAYKHQIEPEILHNDEYAVDTFNYINKTLEDLEMEPWVIEGYVEEVARCKDHPRYKAIQKPRVACEDCWSYYFEQHPESQTTKA